MNRSERRRLERKESKNVKFVDSVNMSSKDKIKKERIQQIAKEQLFNDVNEIEKEIQTNTVISMTSAFVLGMHDEFGFGKVRLGRMLKKVNEMFVAIDCKEITLQEIKDKCNELGLPYESFNQE